jgi:hypothetical protein
MRFLLFLTLSILFAFNGYSQKEDFQAMVLPAELKENADAIVRLDDLNVTINSKRDVRVTRRAVITVFNKAGNRHVIDHIYYSNSVRVRKAEAILYNAMGREVRKLRRRDFKDRSAVSGGTLYSDARYLYVDYTPINYPYTLEISYEVSFSNSSYLPNHFFVNGFNISTEKSSYTINYNPNDLSINYKESLLEEFAVSKSKSNGNLHYNAKNIPAIRFEQYSLPFQYLVPRIQIAPTSFYYEGFTGEATNWNEFGQWFYNSLVAGRDQVSNRTLDEVKSLVEGVEDPIEKARIVYDYVQRNTRYISVQVGIGGYQPITAAEVDRVKYGDCKGLTNYTKALLEAVGVTSYYTRINAGSTQFDFQEDFPSIEQSNHVILAIPHEGDYKWLECTSQIIPFGFIGDFTDNRNALVLKPEGGKIVRTQAYVNEQNLRKTTADYHIDENGNFKASVKILNNGIPYNNRFELERRTTDELHRFYVNNWRNINNLRIIDASFENDKESITFKENLELEARNYAAINGDRMIFNLNSLSNSVSVPSRYRNRAHPVKFSRGYFYEDEYTIHLPKNFEIEALPGGIHTENKFGHYSYSVKKNEDHTLTYKRSFFIKEGLYPKEEYEDFREFFREASLQDNAKIVLIRK